MTVSAEVAEDFRNSLEDLTFNSRWEIVNLTTIARENIIHAQAIARVIHDQIKTVTPSRKLPTFYLLDSIVKNVGTPYTLYFGRDLCPLFMAAYVVVDHQIRRKLEEMLSTWKQPLPGAITAQPVFPVEVTMKIDQILAKARMAGMQPLPGASRMIPLGHPQAQPALRMLPPTQHGYAHQPVPIQQPVYPQQPPAQQGFYGGPPQSPTSLQSPFSPANGIQHNLPRMPGAASSPLQGYSSMHPVNVPPPLNLDSLRNDLSALIGNAKADWSRNMTDPSINNHLKALLDLEHIISTQSLGPGQYAAIHDRISDLSRAPSRQLPMQQNNGHPPPQTLPLNPLLLPQQGPTLDSLLGAGNVAALLASVNARPLQPTPPPQTATPSLNTAQFPGPPSNAQNPASAIDILAAFKAAGVLTGQTDAATAQSGQNTLLSALSQSLGSQASIRGFNTLPEDVPLTSASLKIERPHLISSLYANRGNQCHTCGRRFMATGEGKKRKAAHLDWHFKVNQRMIEAAKRGQNRSWYVDEHEWIKSPPADLDEDLAALQLQEKTENGKQGDGTGSGATAVKKKDRYVPVPSDPSANSNCPVCMEPFVPSWLDAAQRFVYMDTVKAGEKIYHVSCFDAIRNASQVEASRTSTPDSMSRKRKADVVESPRVKMLKEIAA